MKLFAKLGIVWAILTLLFLFLEEIHVNNDMTFEIMAQNLYSISPKKPVSDGEVVSIPANGIMNWAKVMRDAATIEENRSVAFYTIITISSAVIVVLSIYIVRNKGERKLG
jgi:hypothetical protein